MLSLYKQTAAGTTARAHLLSRTDQPLTDRHLLTPNPNPPQAGQNPQCRNDKKVDHRSREGHRKEVLECAEPTETLMWGISHPAVLQFSHVNCGTEAGGGMDEEGFWFWFWFFC